MITPTQYQKLTVEDINWMGCISALGSLENEHAGHHSHCQHNLRPKNPGHFHAAATLLSLIYLSRTVALAFNLRALWSFIYIFCTLFFLKLPKILHKGKLCSLFYALSDEAKYPLVDQRRQKNLEAIDEIQAIANLRKRTAPSS